MLISRSSSYPGGLDQLALLTNPKVGRPLDLHGSQKRHRYDTSACYEKSFSSDRPRRFPRSSSESSLTKLHVRTNEDCLSILKQSKNQLLQTTTCPASLICEERRSRDVCISSKSQTNQSQQVETLRQKLEVQSHDLQSINIEVPKDLHAPASDNSSAGVDGGEAGPNYCVQTTLEGSTMRKIWKKKKQRRKVGSLILLNVLAALYGSSNVANGIITDAAPSLPVSLTSLVRFTSALLIFSPALLSALNNRDMKLLLAGSELGGLAFAATVVDSCNPSSGSSSSAALLFAFTVVLVPIMELCAGRRSGSALTRFATLAAISGMGLLEEEGFGWGGICCPQIGDLWGMAVTIISAVHIFRSESHCSRFDPLLLNAVQCGVLAFLSLGWETTFATIDPADAFRSSQGLVDQIQNLPWAPLVYNGLVCFGLCSWLELHGLRSIHASTATLVYTTIPVWGALLSSFAHHESPADSTLIGALVIMAASIYAQMTTRNETDNTYQRKSCSTNSTVKLDTQEGSNESPSKTAVMAKHDTKMVSDYFPGGLITSQLKFPYYAAQAKKLIVDVKIKLGAIKFLLLSGVSTSIITPPTSGPGSTGIVNPASGTAPVVLPSTNVNNINVTVATHVAKIDASAIQHIAPHGPLLPGSDIANETFRATHTSGLTAVVVNVGTQIFGVVTTGLESAIVAVGSDIMRGFEETENVATLLEHLIQAGVQNAPQSITAWLCGGATWLVAISSNFESTADHIQQLVASGENIYLSVPSKIVDPLLHNLNPLMNQIT